MSEVSQQYCLRWNNHSTNFVTVFEQLLKIEAFTDVTVAGFDGPAIKCHKMVLAACSAYFQELFIKNPCEHPIIILSNVKHFELKAILDYMYRGEVNIAQNDLSELLKVAEFLKVKGLVDEGQVKREEPDNSMSPQPAIGNSTTSSVAHSSGYVSPTQLASSTFIPYGKSPIEKNPNHHLPFWGAFPGVPMPQHPISGHQPPARSQPQHPLLSSSYENVAEASPLSRKKHSSHMVANTPILRNVLGQGQVDSSQPLASELQDRQESSFCSNSNGSTHDSDRRNSAELSEDERRTSPNYPATSNRSGGSSTSRPEWKRYKQYTRENILDAMMAVRDKRMSALQAAREYKVPSRTLYDKLKKAGILPSRGSGVQRLPASLESSARFPYNSSSVNGHVYGGSSRASGSGALSESETEINGFGNDSSSHAQDADMLPQAGDRKSVAGNESTDEVMDMSRRSPSPLPASAAVPHAASQEVQPHASEDEVEDLSVSRTSTASVNGNPTTPANDVRVIVPTGLTIKMEEDAAEEPDGSTRV